MKLGTCAYSYRDLLTNDQMTLEQFLETAVELNFDGVELTSYYFPEETKEYLVKIKRECFVRGLDISGTAVGGNFADPDEANRRAQIDKVKDWVEKSAILGSTVLRVFAGGQPEGVERGVAEDWVRDALAECAVPARREGVILALENHGGLTSDADGTLALVEPLNDPWVGINLDYGNFTGDIYEQFARCAPLTVTTHAKKAYRVGEERDYVDYRKVVRTMLEAGYNGYISIEYEEPEPPIVGVDRFAAYIRGCMADA
jgi:sugar phosphate isomerase/epimerase